MLAFMIRLYRSFWPVNLAVRVLVGLHHILIPANRAPCKLPGVCSMTGLAEAQALGFRALPGILARMAACGPGVTSDPDCQKTKPCSSVAASLCPPDWTGTDEHCQSWIGIRDRQKCSEFYRYPSKGN
jgi:hypothetical protein